MVHAPTECMVHVRQGHCIVPLTPPTRFPQAVTNKETVSISGFGKFVPTMSAGRNYRNIQTGASVYKGPTMKVKFRPYKHFKECVEEGKFEK